LGLVFLELQAAVLEKINEANYLSADNYVRYRTVMRIFFREYQHMNYQLDKEAVYSVISREPVFSNYPIEQLSADLQQLVQWKNLTAIQDPRKVHTISDFKNKQYQYMITTTALEIERMTIVVENLSTRSSGLYPSPFRRIYSALSEIDKLNNMPTREVGAWWEDLQEDFKRLRQSHQDYLREFYGPGTEKNMKSTAFIIHKQHLIRYLEDFIRDLQTSSIQIGGLINKITNEQTNRILTLVHKSLMDVPRIKEEPQMDINRQIQGAWMSLVNWFTGEPSTVSQVLEVTNEVIRRIVHNAAMLVQIQNMGVSRKAELRRFLSLFAGCESVGEAHKLSSQVFGVQESAHFIVDADRTTDRIDISTYDEPPMESVIHPRTKSYKPRMERMRFEDKSAQKAAQQQIIMQQRQRLQGVVDGFIRNGVLDFKAIDQPLTPEVRDIFLSWITAANLDTEHKGHTEYGRSFTLETRTDYMLSLPCTDGDLTMPDYILRFHEEPSYV